MVAAVWQFIGGVFGLMTILILAFYLMLDAENLVRSVRAVVFPVPSDRASRARAARVSDEGECDGSEANSCLREPSAARRRSGLFLMGVPYFYVLALIAASRRDDPCRGTAAGSRSGNRGRLHRLAGARARRGRVLSSCSSSLKTIVLVPKVMERQVGVSAAGVIVGLLVGGTLLGIVGAILAVPTVAILQVIFQELTAEASPEDTSPDSHADGGPVQRA